jgi:hypothetical protein
VIPINYDPVVGAVGEGVDSNGATFVQNGAKTLFGAGRIWKRRWGGTYIGIAPTIPALDSHILTTPRLL